MPYFRLRFHLEPTYRFRTEASGGRLKLHIADGVHLEATREGDLDSVDRFALRSRAYDTDDEARCAGERWGDALLVAGLRARKGLDLGRFRNRGRVLSDVGRAHFEQLVGAPVRLDMHGLDIVDVVGTRFVEFSAAPQVISTAEHFALLLASSVRTEALRDELRLALELYGLSRFAAEPRAGFLTLVSAIEVLASRSAQPSDFCDAVDSFLNSLSKPVRTESLIGRIKDLKLESISQACQRFVSEAVGEGHVREFKTLYGLRSKLLHVGTADTDFIAERTRAERLVAEILTRLTD